MKRLDTEFERMPFFKKWKVNTKFHHIFKRCDEDAINMFVYNTTSAR